MDDFLTDDLIEQLAWDYKGHVESRFYVMGDGFDMLPELSDTCYAIASAIILEGLDEHDVDEFIEDQIIEFNKVVV